MVAEKVRVIVGVDVKRAGNSGPGHGRGQVALGLGNLLR